MDVSCLARLVELKGVPVVELKRVPVVELKRVPVVDHANPGGFVLLDTSNLS